jgi:hypothetical protein
MQIFLIVHFIYVYLILYLARYVDFTFCFMFKSYRKLFSIKYYGKITTNRNPQFSDLCVPYTELFGYKLL